MSLAGKCVLITNASTSLAYSIARQLGLCGAKIFVTDLDQKKLNYTLDGLRGADIPEKNLFGIAVDLGVEDGRRELFGRISADYGRLDALIHANKPNFVRGDIMLSRPDDLQKIYAQFVNQPFLISQLAIPLLEKTEGRSSSSSIIFLSSIAAFTPFLDIGLFSATQTAVLGLSKAMAQSLAGKHIRVNSICLGLFEDDGAGASWSGCSGASPDRSAEEAEQIRSSISAMIPIGRLARASDAVGLVEFLVSDRSSYATGEVFTLSGGISVRI